MLETQRFRRETAITTYTVVSHVLWERNCPLERFGPHELRQNAALMPSGLVDVIGGYRRAAKDTRDSYRSSRANSSRLIPAARRMLASVPRLSGRLPWTGTGIASGMLACRRT